MADIYINLESSNAKELIAQAVRAYATGDFLNAAAAFGRATELMAQEHGDSHDSLGEIHIQYAKSLLELSREENVPFGDAIPHGEIVSDSDDIEGESGEIAENVEEDENKAEEENKAEDEKKVDDEKKIEEKKVEDKKVENGDAQKNGTNESDEPKDDDEEEAQEENGEAADPSAPAEDENCSDLQLAWEVLEVAKKIFYNRGESGKERLAETMILLGEVAMESENFTGGINDMKEGIELQKKLFEPTSRKIAESHYKLGTAQLTISNIAEAVENFEASIKVLKNRIDLLQSQSDEGKTEKDIRSKNDEIEEMKALIPEIEEKINDTIIVKEQMTAQIIQEITGIKSKAEEKDGACSTSKEQKPKDISHLVKRKRKAEEVPSKNVAKKPTP